eukprot:SAG31_NODE_8923_length_1362_cov_26.665875_1_plen_67_part_00
MAALHTYLVGADGEIAPSACVTLVGEGAGPLRPPVQVRARLSVRCHRLETHTLQAARGRAAEGEED